MNDLEIENLIKEGVSKKSVFITGNTVIDSLMYIDKRLQKNKLKLMVNGKREI